MLKMEKRKKHAAFAGGILGGVLCNLVVVFFKGYTGLSQAGMVVSVLASLSAGFLFCFVLTLWALKILGNKDWKYAFLLGPVLGFLAGGITGAASGIIIAPDLFSAAAFFGCILGASIGTVCGFLFFPPLAFIARNGGT